MASFSERIKELRLSSNLSLRQLSKLTNISHSAISAYEKGKREPSFESIEALCDVFNCDIDYLLGRSDIKCALLHGTGYNTLYEAYKNGIDIDSLPLKESPSTEYDEGEQLMIELYRGASPEVRELVISILTEVESYPEESRKMLLGMVRGAFEKQ